jgi:hypothetical protein
MHAQAVWLAGQAVEKGHKALLAALGLHHDDKHYRYLGHDISEISKLLPDELHEPRDPALGSLLLGVETRALIALPGWRDPTRSWFDRLTTNGPS